MGDDQDISAELPSDLPAPDGEPLPEPVEFLSSESSDALPTPEGEAPVDALAEPHPEGEASNAAVAVDEMLSAEMLPEGLDTLPSPEEALLLPAQPTFQIQLRIPSEEARTALKKALDAQGVVISEKAWAAPIPVVSQLTEYQGIVILQAARALGVPAEGAVVMPSPVPSEEDLALGDLAIIPDAPGSTTEAAPSVVLPKGEREVLLCAPDHLPGGTVRESKGIVVAHRSIPRRLFREDELREKMQKELSAVPNRAAPALPSSHLQLALRDLFLDLRKSALAQGANSVLGVKLEAFPESGVSDPQLEQLRLVAFGTAAVVEKC